MRKSRLNKKIQEKLIEHFVAGTTARTATELFGVNKNTAAYYYHRLREIIHQKTEVDMPFFGEIEVDESYFGGKRKGKKDVELQEKYLFLAFLKEEGKYMPQLSKTQKQKHLCP